MMDVIEGYDHIVIGAGSAGAAITRRLVDAGRKVLLIEAGAADDLEPIHQAGSMLALRGSTVDYGYETVPQAELGGRTIGWPRGKVLGGSSAINGMIFVRGHPADYDTWAYHGADGWHFADVLPYFKRLERFDDGETALRGGNGPLPVTRNRQPHPVTVATVAAAVDYGLPFNADYNGEQILGISYTQINVVNGRRVSTWQAYGAPIADNPLLTIRANTQALRLVFEGNRAVGAVIAAPDGHSVVRSAGDIIVSSGAIGSAQLLLLSGLGSADDLRRLGIDPVADLPGVGQNLHDHTISQVAWRSKRPLRAPSANHLEAHIFASSRPGRTVPDTQPVTGLFAYPVEGYAPFAPDQTYAWFPGVIRPLSRGRLNLRSTDPAEPPLIDPGYLREPQDLEAMLFSLKMCRDIGNSSALDDWSAGELAPGPHVKSDDELRAYIRRSLDTYFHPVGTCRIGRDSLAVVDPELRVHGIDNLRVADASVFPAVPSGNTHGPAVMVGERAADFLLHRAPAGTNAEPSSTR
jgi:choline dehydrogenase-like flavoprotein